MHSGLFKVFVCFATICALASGALAQNASKILKFTDKKTVIVEKGTVPGDGTTTFLIEAKNWNLLRFTVTGSYADGSEGQGLSADLTKFNEKKVLATGTAGEPIEFQAQSDGIYVLTVKNPGPSKANVSVRISLNE